MVLSHSDVSRRVDMLKEFHVKNLQQRMKLAEKVHELNSTLEQSKLVAESNCEKFTVDPDLRKFVYGTKGENIIKARFVTTNVFFRYKHSNAMYSDVFQEYTKLKLMIKVTWSQSTRKPQKRPNKHDR